MKSQKVKLLILHIIEIILFLTFIAGALGQLGSWWWVFEILSHFYHAYLAIFIIVLIIFLVQRKILAAMLSLVGLIASGLLIFSVYLPSKAINSNSDFVRIMSYNTNFYLNNSDQIANTIQQLQPDIVVLLESNKSTFASLQENFKTDYTYSYLLDRQQPANIALLSKLELSEPELLTPANSPAGFVRTEFKYKNNPIALFAIHPYPPYNKKLAHNRRDYYEFMAQIASQEKIPTIMIGDFNTTPWSPLFRDLVKDSGLRDSRLDFGIQPSWPTFLPAFIRIPLDHALVSESIIVNDRFIGNSKTSDHSPVIIDISLR